MNTTPKEQQILKGIFLLNKEKYKESIVPNLMTEKEFKKLENKMRKIRWMK